MHVLKNTLRETHNKCPSIQVPTLVRVWTQARCATIYLVKVIRRQREGLSQRKWWPAALSALPGTWTCVNCPNSWLQWALHTACAVSTTGSQLRDQVGPANQKAQAQTAKDAGTVSLCISSFPVGGGFCYASSLVTKKICQTQKG